MNDKIRRGIFLANLSNSSDLQETLVIVIFGVTVNESSVKVEVAPFSILLGPTLAVNLCITRDRLVPRARGRLHHFFRPILCTARAHLRNFSKNPNLEKFPYYSEGIFLVNLSNFSDLQDTTVIGVFWVSEFECSLKIEVAQFFVLQGPIFAENLCITRERWVARSRRCFRGLSRPILHREREHLRKFPEGPNFEKCPY